MLHRTCMSTSFIWLCLFALSACSEKPQHDPRTSIPLVRTAAVKPAPSQTRTFTGVVGARVQSDLAFRVSGKVLERYVDAGQKLKRGQALFRIDPNDLLLSAKGQQETVMAAKARADQTAQEEIRHQGLVEAGAISASTYDQIKAAADAAKAQLKASESQADVARNASSYATLFADSDGVIVETLAEPGQVVSAGQAVIRVAHAGEREAIVNLPETLHPPLGMKAIATLYGKENHPSIAKLRQLSESADPLTRTYEARFTLGNQIEDARLGATVNIQIKQDDADHGGYFVLPIGAIFDAGKAPGVWLVDTKSSTVHWSTVRLISVGEDTAIVEGKFNQADQVVALGAHLLKQGEKVSILGDPQGKQALNGGVQK